MKFFRLKVRSMHIVIKKTIKNRQKFILCITVQYYFMSMYYNIISFMCANIYVY